MRVLVERLVALVPALLGLSMLTYALLALAPGDPVRAMLGSEADPQAVAALRAKFTLDAPLPWRFAVWLGHAASGDLGRSIETGRPVLAMVGAALGPTLELAAAALTVAVLIGLPAGVLAAARRNRAADIAVSLIALCGLSMPGFWLAILLIQGLTIHLPVLPSSGHVAVMTDPVQALRHLILPALTLGVPFAAVTLVMVRAAMLEVLPADWIRTARAKGLAERRVVWRHALRAALVPVVTVAGLQLGHLLGGMVVVETVFAWPGIGKLLVDAILACDTPLVAGTILVTGTLFVLVNLAAELLAARFDPRLRDPDPAVPRS